MFTLVEGWLMYHPELMSSVSQRLASQSMRQSSEPALDGLPPVEMQGDTAHGVGKGSDDADGHGADGQRDERRGRADPPEAQPGDESNGDGRQQSPEHLGP